MNKWSEIKLKECITTLKGFAFKSAWYQESGTAIVRVSDFTENSIDISAIQYISNEKAVDYQRYTLDAKDIIIQTVGSWQHNPASIVGKVINVPIDLKGSLLNQNAVKIIPKKTIDKSFLYFRLKDEHFKYYNLGCAQGAANQASITLSSIGNFKFKLPPLPTQKKIAKILSNYDDLIANNLKRIKLLEESAKLTYEEWFLRFRIDGEKLEIDSETGLPFGWEKKKLTEVIELNPLTAITRGIEQPFIPMGSLSETSMLIDDIKTRIPQGGARFKNFDTLLARITPSLENGKTGFIQCLKEGEVATGSTEFIVMRATEVISPYYVYPLARTEAFREIAIQSMSGSDGRQRVKVKVFEKILLNIPTEEIRDKYHFSMKKVFDEIQVLANQNKLLREARDILLPRLMTGMIDVEDMEIAI